MKTLVLGLGNELYGDDGAGIHVVRRIKKDLMEMNKVSVRFKNVTFEECSLSGLALLDVIIGYDRLIIIDTIKKENPHPGKIRILKEKNVRYIPGPSPHYVSLPQTLEIGRRMGLKVPSEIQIIAIEAKNIYNLGEELTQEMTEAIPVIIKKVYKSLESEEKK